VATDYYELLGVSPDASIDDIKRAYRQLARQLHPDANPGDSRAEARFKEIAVAYETLSDPERRRRYDMFGPEGVGAAAGGGATGFGDLFDMFFGGSPFGGGGGGGGGSLRGADLEVVLDLSFEDAVFGAQAPVRVRTAVPCEHCQATGASPGTSPQQCPDCSGSGQVRRVRQSILGQMVTATQCPRCGGLGTVVADPCAVCHGEGRRLAEKVYTVDVPAGIDTGSTLRLAGRGAAGLRGGGLGDLYVHLRVAPHDRFTRQGYDLVHQLRLPFTQAVLGAVLELETLDGTEELVVPRGTPPDRVFRLRGRGVPHVEGRGRGDLLVEVHVDVPTELGEQEEELLRQLAELRGEEVAPADDSFFSRLRSAFK
jgi:molecular chaperone DnaJ